MIGFLLFVLAVGIVPLLFLLDYRKATKEYFSEKKNAKPSDKDNKFKEIISFRPEKFNIGRTFISVLLEDSNELEMIVEGSAYQPSGYIGMPVQVFESVDNARQYMLALKLNQYGLVDHRYPNITHYSNPVTAHILRTEDNFKTINVDYIEKVKIEDEKTSS